MPIFTVCDLGVETGEKDKGGQISTTG